MAYRYVPMMKTKAGEIAALQNLSPTTRAKVMPLFHVCETVAPSFVPQLSTAWAGQLTALDGLFNYNHAGSAATFSALMQAMRHRGIPTMPSFSSADPLPYQQAAQSLIDDTGAVVKVSLANLSNIPAWLTQRGLSSSAVDLVVDVKHVASIDVPSYAGYVIAVLNQNTAALALFRTVTLAAAAAPKDNGGLQYGVNLVPRIDWQLWSAVRTAVPFQLDYGDYLTGHPDLTEPPGVAMANATVSARYSLDNEWLIIKGRSTGGQYGQPMTVQYRSHAGVISAHPGFSGVPGAWADGQIMQAAAGAPGMGSRQKWSSFAANRHISLVANRLP